MFACFTYTTIQFYSRDLETPRYPEHKKTSHHRIDTSLAKYQACQIDDSVELPDLRTVERWKSKKTLPLESMSIVTQLSLERMNMLKMQCSSWTDRIAGVVYVPYVKGFGVASSEVRAVNGSSLTDIVAFLDTFHETIENDKSACALDMELVIETFDSWKDENLGLYPFNAVRNRALMMATTKAIILLDVDFLPSRSFSQMYQSKPDVFNALMKKLNQQKTAIILPAFETKRSGADGRMLAKRIARGGKDSVIEAFKNEAIRGFQLDKYPAGHSPTQFDSWVEATKPYLVEYQKGFEPYIMIHRQYVPWYDERFRGYGRDKIVHLTHIADQLKIKLEVHDAGFVIHSPHMKASTFKNTKNSGQWDALLDLYVKARRDVSIGEFVPVTSFAESCTFHVSSTTVSKARKNKLKKIRKAKKKDRKSLRVEMKTLTSLSI